jgi:hypothetical protein
MRKVVIIGIVLSSLFGLLAPFPPFSGPSLALAQSCNTNENLEEVAISFIGRCCKGAILREFPGQLLFTKIEDIRRGSTSDHKKAWKLLNNSRFRKWSGGLAQTPQRSRRSAGHARRPPERTKRVPPRPASGACRAVPWSQMRPERRPPPRAWKRFLAAAWRLPRKTQAALAETPLRDPMGSTAATGPARAGSLPRSCVGWPLSARRAWRAPLTSTASTAGRVARPVAWSPPWQECSGGTALPIPAPRPRAVAEKGLHARRGARRTQPGVELCVRVGKSSRIALRGSVAQQTDVVVPRAS